MLLALSKTIQQTLILIQSTGKSMTTYQAERAGSQTYPNYDYRVAATMFETQSLVSAM